MSINRHGKLKFDSAMPDKCSDNIGAYLRDGYGGQLTSTDVDVDIHALDVFMQGFNPDLVDGDGYLYVSVTNPTPSASEYAEDSAHTDGDDGVFTLAVQHHAETSMVDADGDYAAFQLNNLGRLKVDVDFRDTLVNDDGYLFVDLVDDLTLVVQSEYAEDSVHTSGDIGNFMLAVRHDAETSLVDADGDYAPLQVDALGRLKVITDVDTVNIDFNSEKVEDSVHVTGDIGSYMLSVRSDSLPATANTSADGDYASVFVDAYGAMWTDSVGSKFDGDADDGTAPEDRPVKVGTRTMDCPLTATTADTRADMVSDLYRRLYVNSSSNVAGSTAVLTAADVAAKVVATPLGGRKTILVQNKGDEMIYLGFANTVTADDTSTGGIELDCNDVMELQLGDCIDLWVITESGETSTVKIMELG